MKGLLLIVFALLIDLLQALMSLALLGMLTGLTLVPILGQIFSVINIPLGFVLGIAISMSLSLTAGIGHLFAFFISFNTSASSLKTKIEARILRRILIMLLGEVIPVINNLPWLTIATLLALWSIRREEKKNIAAPETPSMPAANDNYPAANDTYPRRVGAEVMAAALVLLFFFGASSAAYAQAVPPPIQYVVTPETPGPKSPVIIEAQGVGSFLGDATITWTQDGKTVKQGVGERSYAFTTGVLGQKTVVEVVIDSSQGFFSSKFTFNPSKINLLWEADTSVPKLYLGRALYSAGSNYKVVAFPTVYSGSSRIAPSALSYQWSYKGDSVPEASGLGRAIFSRTGDQLQAGEEIGLDVYYGTQKVGSAGLTIPAVAPKLMLYPRDALRGEILEAALPAAISLTASEITVQAEPYYFANAGLKTAQAPFAWTINGTAATGPDSAQGILTLRATGSGQGEAQIGVSIQNNNPDQFVQSASASLRLVFGVQTSDSLLNFFGL